MRVIEAVGNWMSSNRLRLNADKTQFIWLGSGHFLDVLQVNSIPANEVVNNLEVYFDPELLMGRQVNKLCQVCYFHLRRLSTVRRSLTKESVDARARLHHKPSRPLQRCPLRVEWIFYRPTSIRPELGCEADPGCSFVQQRFCRHP